MFHCVRFRCTLGFSRVNTGDPTYPSTSPQKFRYLRGPGGLPPPTDHTLTATIRNNQTASTLPSTVSTLTSPYETPSDNVRYVALTSIPLSVDVVDSSELLLSTLDSTTSSPSCPPSGVQLAGGSLVNDAMTTRLLTTVLRSLGMRPTMILLKPSGLFLRRALRKLSCPFEPILFQLRRKSPRMSSVEGVDLAEGPLLPTDMRCPG